jgi:hypothetical protein
LYPDAKFICLLRDPRDVLKSQKNRWKRRRFTTGKKHPFMASLRQMVNYHPITISKLWTGIIPVIKSNADHSNFILIKYEDLLTDTKNQLTKICDFTGIKYSDEMIQIPNIGSSLKSDKPGAIGIDKTKLSGWKKGGLNKAEIIICEKLCHQGLKYFNYEESDYNFHWKVLWYYLIFPFQMVLILMFNLSKSKNLMETIKRRLN